MLRIAAVVSPGRTLPRKVGMCSSSGSLTSRDRVRTGLEVPGAWGGGEGHTEIQHQPSFAAAGGRLCCGGEQSGSAAAAWRQQGSAVLPEAPMNSLAAWLSNTRAMFARHTGPAAAPERIYQRSTTDLCIATHTAGRYKISRQLQQQPSHLVPLPRTEC